MKPLIDKALILAHRGASGYAPDNTMEAFELAHKMGADGVELDAYLTADGEVVVIHDPKINAVSNAQGFVSEYTLAELKAFDFGYQFYKGQRKGIKIPTLNEVYDFISTTNMIVNVEMKIGDQKIISACHKIAAQHNMQERIIYSSFDHYQVRRMHEFDPSTLVAPLIMHVSPLDPAQYCAGLGARAIHPLYTQLRYADGYIENCHESGIRVHTWTTNSEEHIRFSLNQGVDGIITNYPDIAIKIRDEIRSKP
ncbi:MAG: glycerophosphodiester phosphodiesterase [Clostridia bacterium]|nr:glycerophosphodiester phosphodiesterase [Clostridia bacterium]